MSMIYAQWRFPSIAKSTMSHPEMGYIGKQNVLFRTMEWGILRAYMLRNALRYAPFNIPLHLFCDNILSK